MKQMKQLHVKLPAGWPKLRSLWSPLFVVTYAHGGMARGVRHSRK